MPARTASNIDALRAAALPLTGGHNDYDALLDEIGDARIVLIGEASHGTFEFYEERAQITRRLITEKGFSAVAAEADWPDAYRANAYVRHQSRAATAEESLRGFMRFPTWMWRNTVMVDFIEWLRGYNSTRNPGQTAGFYGLDLYSLYASIEAVVDYLDKVDPDAAARARDRYACFDHASEDSQRYGYDVAFGAKESCEDEAVEQLLDLRERAADYARRDGRVAEDEQFYAEQNARLVQSAEEYYRGMFDHRVNTWNLRDNHMTDTLAVLVEHLENTGRAGKVVVWAHNSHVGDARATEMGAGRGEVNVGQLARERFGTDAFNIGLTTHTGTVTAASDWGGPPERKHVRPSLSGSYENILKQVELPRFMLRLREPGLPIAEPRLERAIGVIYRPETERLSHYFDAYLTRQFDVVLHFNETAALEPLERTPLWERGELPETYPFAE